LSFNRSIDLEILIMFENLYNLREKRLEAFRAKPIRSFPEQPERRQYRLILLGSAGMFPGYLDRITEQSDDRPAVIAGYLDKPIQYFNFNFILFNSFLIAARQTHRKFLRVTLRHFYACLAIFQLSN